MKEKLRKNDAERLSFLQNKISKLEDHIICAPIYALLLSACLFRLLYEIFSSSNVRFLLFTLIFLLIAPSLSCIFIASFRKRITKLNIEICGIFLKENEECLRKLKELIDDEIHECVLEIDEEVIKDN